MSWLRMLLSLDFKGDPLLWKYVNDFQSLYLRRAINRGKWQWATIGEKLRFYLTNLYADRPLDSVWEEALELEKYFLFNELKGKAKGEMIRICKESFSRDFIEYSGFPQRMLKGKSPVRQYWHVLNPGNIADIRSWISDFKKRQL